MIFWMIWFSIGALFFAIGLILILGGSFKEKRCCEETIAIVEKVDTETVVERSRQRQRSTFYTPFVKYTVEGQEIRKKSFGSTTKYKEGQEVSLYYNPQKPTDCYIDKETKMAKVMGVMLGFMGIIVMAVGRVFLKLM